MRLPTAKPASPATRALEVVPPSGPTAWLTIFTAGAMTFLCVFALALSLASGRLANRWSEALARTATIRLSAPAEQVQIQTDAILAVLATTPGIASFRAIDEAETRALLEPWFGPGLPIEALPIPLERRGEPDDIAAVIDFLVSPDAAFVHGSVLFVDGGTDALARPHNV